MNNSSSHITVDTLADLAEDRTAPEATAAHLATCPACDSTLRQLRELIHTMRHDKAEEAPGDVLTSAINIFSLGTKSPPSSLRRLVATLTFDSLTTIPAFGMRSGFLTSRQLIYTAQGIDIDFRVTTQNEGCVVAGQIIREDTVAGLLELSGDCGFAEATINELGEFTLPAIPPGKYLLRVTMGDVEVEIPEIELST